MKLPARDGDHAISFEVLEVFLEGLHGVEIVLAQREGTGGGGGPGIDKCHLYYVVFVPRTADVGAAVLYVNMHLRPVVEAERIIRVLAAHNIVDDDWVDFDSGYAGTAVGHSPHHVDAAAWSDDGKIAAR